MNKHILLVMATATALILGSCRDQLIRTTVDASSIPDQKYNVMVYERGGTWYYAVLLDIPDDGTELVMRDTPHATRMGLDSPGKYVDMFDNRIKVYRTIRISDQNDIVRGYLMVTYRLNYWTKQGEGKIVVAFKVDESYFGGP